MSDDNPQPESPQAAKGRSPMERILVWGGILLLAAVAGFEYFAQQNYNTALNWLIDNENVAESVVDENLAGASISEKVDITDEAQKAAGETKTFEKRYNWASLFKTYEVIAEFDEKDGVSTIAGYKTAIDMEELGKAPELESVEGVNTVRDGSADAPTAAGDE